MNDSKGSPLKVGDIVTVGTPVVRKRVTAITGDSATLECEHPTDPPRPLTIANSSSVTKV